MSGLGLNEAAVTRAMQEANYHGNVEDGRRLIRAYLDEIEWAMRQAAPLNPAVVVAALYPDRDPES